MQWNWKAQTCLKISLDCRIYIVFALAEAVCADEFRDAMKKRPDVHLVIVDESHTIEMWAGEI